MFQSGSFANQIQESFQSGSSLTHAQEKFQSGPHAHYTQESFQSGSLLAVGLLIVVLLVAELHLVVAELQRVGAELDRHHLSRWTGLVLMPGAIQIDLLRRLLHPFAQLSWRVFQGWPPHAVA